MALTWKWVQRKAHVAMVVMGNYFEVCKIVGGKMAWHYLGILNISLWASGGMSGKNEVIYSLQDVNVQDEVRVPDDEEKGHQDVGTVLCGEGTGLYDKNLDLKIGLLSHHTADQL